jgi:TldD protein
MLRSRLTSMLFATTLSFAAVNVWAATRADANQDPVLKAMLEEMERSEKQLQLPNFQTPFFIQYRIEDVDEFETRASYGASLGSRRSHQRMTRVTVLVGDYKTDSSTPRGDGSVQYVAIDGDPIAIRSALWAATDTAYKAALHAFTQKQAALKQVQTAPQADDFSREKPVIILEKPQQLEINEAEWIDRVAAASSFYSTGPEVKSFAKDIQISSAGFRGRIVTRYLVNSEGTVIRKSESSYSETLSVMAQAADGMRLERSYGSNGTSLNQIDTAETFRKHSVAILNALEELKRAPLVEEEYHGPVLFSNDSSADVINELVAPAVVAQRPDLGTEARTKGPYASSYHSRVLPDFLDVTDDPGKKFSGSQGLLGSYGVDDEGVPAQAVPVVVHGRLQNYLIGRSPIRDFPQSNGHGRAVLAAPARPNIGVLEVKATETSSDEELNQKLLEMAKDRGLKNVYYVETMGPELTPRLIYRISTDGKRELVRGAMLEDLDQRSLRSGILAAGRDPFVANYLRDVPTTVLAPAFLFEDITVKRANEKNPKLPYYPSPAD